LRKERPREKIAIFSGYLNFLDIIAEALERGNDAGADIQCLLYDQSMEAHDSRND